MRNQYISCTLFCAAIIFCHCGGKPAAAIDAAGEDSMGQEDSAAIESGDSNTYVCGSNVCTPSQLCLLPCTVARVSLLRFARCADSTTVLAAGPCLNSTYGVSDSPCLVNCCDNQACRPYFIADADAGAD